LCFNGVLSFQIPEVTVCTNWFYISELYTLRTARICVAYDFCKQVSFSCKTFTDFVSVMETACVYCVLRVELLNTITAKFSFQARDMAEAGFHREGPGSVQGNSL
jgi:hypothetical protein